VSDLLDNKLTILVVGIVRNVALTIEKDKTIIESALKDFRSIKWFLVESDSDDHTLSKLEALSKKDDNFRFESLGKIQSRSEPRTVALARARNRYLLEIKENEIYKAVDFLAISDFNGLNKKLSQTAVRSCFDAKDWDVCFANQTRKYYDIWALRHPIWSPNDCWKQLDFFRKYHKFPEFSLAASVRSRMIHIPRGSEWIEVDSAFGGFAIYRLDAIGEAIYLGVTETGDAICEHVPFHEEMRKNKKKLFINPNLINARSTDHSIRMNSIYTFLRIARYPFKLARFWITKFRR
jgi:glycosyltransferase involved in cell wall biosynthesis